MATYHVTRVLPYAPEQVFTLVGDVQAYPQFVPWITALRAGEPRVEAPGVDVVEAQADVGFSVLKEAFATRVRRDANARQIEVDLISGPFKRLSNQWSFRPHRAGCEVVFDIDFQFKNRMLELLLKANFGYAVDRLIGCFEGRAAELYGGAAPGAGVSPPSGRPTALAPS